MELPFAESRRSTLGLEWELALVDRQTGDLRSVADRILSACHEDMPDLRPEDEHPFVKQELLTNTVELVTDVCPDVNTGVDQLRETASNVMRHCEPLDVSSTARARTPSPHPPSRR